MWITLLKSKFAAWFTAILSAIAMVYIFWTSQRKVQLSEIKSEGAISLEKEKTKWHDEQAATEIVEREVAYEKQKEAFVEAVNAHNNVTSMADTDVRSKLESKWTRKDE